MHSTWFHNNKEPTVLLVLLSITTGKIIPYVAYLNIPWQYLEYYQSPRLDVKSLSPGTLIHFLGVFRQIEFLLLSYHFGLTTWKIQWVSWIRESVNYEFFNASSLSAHHKGWLYAWEDSLPPLLPEKEKEKQSLSCSESISK